MEKNNVDRLKSAILMALVITALLAGVGIMIDVVDDSQENGRNQAVPTTDEVTPSPPNDSSIGQEAGPYR